jgi:hypothetical protein
VRLKLVIDVVLLVPACGGHVYMLVMDDSKTLEYCYLIVFYKILIWAGQCEIMMTRSYQISQECLTLNVSPSRRHIFTANSNANDLAVNPELLDFPNLSYAYTLPS